jgi:hypothetical protein
VIDPGQFGQRIMQALRSRGETRPLHFDEERFSILIGEVGSNSVLLVSLRDVCSDCEKVAAEHQEQVIARYIKVWGKGLNAPKDYALAQPRLGVSLRHSGFFERHPWLIHRELTNELSVALVDDDGDALYDLRETSLADWQVTLDVCMADALRNLAKSPWILEQVGHIWRSCALDSYDAARILLHPAIGQLEVKGSPVVLVPDRDCLVVTGSDDIDGLRQIAATGHVRIEEASRLISGTPLVLRGSTWEEFEPPAQARAAFAHLSRVYDELNYREQTSFLRAQSAGPSSTLFVAEVQVFQTGPDKHETFTCLPSIGPTLLPKADWVALYDVEADTIQTTSWADLFRVLIRRMSPVQRHPVRYRLETFPSLEERQKMGGTPRPVQANLQSAHPPLRPGPRLR